MPMISLTKEQQAILIRHPYLAVPFAKTIINFTENRVLATYGVDDLKNHIETTTIEDTKFFLLRCDEGTVWVDETTFDLLARQFFQEIAWIPKVIIDDIMIADWRDLVKKQLPRLKKFEPNVL